MPAYPNTGSEGHYQQDMQAFQSWGFDYVKVDWCGGNAEGLDQQSTYQAISSADAAATAVTGSAYRSVGGDDRRWPAPRLSNVQRETFAPCFFGKGLQQSSQPVLE